MSAAPEDQPPRLPLIDPTANVLKLVEQAVLRLNDLRAADREWQNKIDAIEMKCEADKDALRDKLREAETRRIDAVNLAESRRLDSVNSETKAAVALASERAATTAATLATNLATTTSAQNDRMSRLEQQMYQSGGAVQGGREVKTDAARSLSLVFGLIGTLLGIGGVVAAVAVALSR